MKLVCQNEISEAECILSHYADSGCSVRFLPCSEISNETSQHEIVLVGPNSEIKQLSKMLFNHGILRFELFISDLFDKENIETITIVNDRPRLDRLEVEIFKKCNLNCRSCSHYSNIVSGNGTVDIVSFERDLTQLKSFYWGIESLRLMGGEPLLADNYTDFVEISRNLFPDQDISIVSNGLLIPEITHHQCEVLKKCRCRVVISNYPPTQKNMKSIISQLESNGVEYKIGPPIRFFYKSLLPEPNNDPRSAYDHCLFKACHAIMDGKLSMCGLELYSYRFNIAFKQAIPESGSINLYTTKMDGWQIDQYINSMQDICHYCHSAYIPVKWSQCSKSCAKETDYYVKSTFYEKKFMPFIQHIFLPIIKRTYNHRVKKYNNNNKKPRYSTH